MKKCLPMAPVPNAEKNHEHKKNHKNILKKPNSRYTHIMIQLKKNIAGSILKQNLHREHHSLQALACKSSQALRFFPEREEIPERLNIRPAFFHDIDRIIHSLAYTRYSDKTQVFSQVKNDHITHRMQHVQYVSKIARTIGRFLRLNEDLIEAIALGHDIGHTPFGHEGESILNRICQEKGQGAFAHNYQSMRVLMEIENQGLGLNLTTQVLDGILCHNGEILDRKYTPDYDKTAEVLYQEYQQCGRQQEASRKIRPMTLEGAVVRVSDIIAYVGKDIEDALRLKLISKKDLPKAAVDVLGNSNREMIHNLIVDLVNQSHDQEALSFSAPVYTALMKLKDWNYQNIYKSTQKNGQYEKIKMIFTFLYDHYSEDLRIKNKECDIFKAFLDYKKQSYIENNSIHQKVVDFIAGMTDEYFLGQFKKLSLPELR
ncbi:MAG: HD domain-containing protein [Spirochaetales bacterium]|nr:HD domain-containing protein [Spirochaetales bacterium]